MSNFLLKNNKVSCIIAPIHIFEPKCRTFLWKTLGFTQNGVNLQIVLQNTIFPSENIKDPCKITLKNNENERENKVAEKKMRRASRVIPHLFLF